MIARRSNSPRAKERRRLYGLGCEWAKAPGVCELTGVPVDPSEAHLHHVFTAGAFPELYLCPWNWLVLHGMVHGEFHDVGYEERKKAIERRFPGLYDLIGGMRPEWIRKPLDEVQSLLEGLPPREEFLRTEMGRI